MPDYPSQDAQPRAEVNAAIRNDEAEKCARIAESWVTAWEEAGELVAPQARAARAIAIAIRQRIKDRDDADRADSQVEGGQC